MSIDTTLVPMSRRGLHPRERDLPDPAQSVIAKKNGRAESFLRRGRSRYACVFSRQLTYLQYFLNRSLTRPQCSPARKLSMYLARAGPSLW